MDLTRNDRVTIYGALIWMADELRSQRGEHTLRHWAGKGEEAFAAERKVEMHVVAQK